MRSSSSSRGFLLNKQVLTVRTILDLHCITHTTAKTLETVFCRRRRRRRRRRRQSIGVSQKS